MASCDRVLFALPALFDAVVARFEEDGLEVPNFFGWREPQKNKRTKSRIVWVPGAPTGSAGVIMPARNPGTNPQPQNTGRSLATLNELFHVVITAVSKKDSEDELLQYEAVRLLYDAWYRAVYLAAHGTFGVQSTDWNLSKNERRHGAELIALCTIQSMIPDKAHGTAPTDAMAVIDVSLEDVTDQITVALPP